jgi:hypothetical protein
MHASATRELQALAERALQLPAGPARWQTFLDGLAPSYASWRAADRRDPGFLLFHWQMLRSFTEAGVAERFGGVKPITEASLAAIGAPYGVRNLVPRGDIEALVTFSAALEAWHQGALAKMTCPGHDLEDAAGSVYLLDFWRLHAFIIARFEQKLRTFRETPTQAIPGVIEMIVSRHHAWVPSI